MADEYLTNLYDNAGQYVGDALTEEDLSAAVNRELVIDSGGKIYVWNQRNNQWRESAGVIILSGLADPAETKSDDGLDD